MGQQDLNWGAFDHASHAPQLRSCNYNIHIEHAVLPPYIPTPDHSKQRYIYYVFTLKNISHKRYMYF